MCIIENCNTRPIYNLEGETKAIYCSSHKLEGMIDIKNKKCLFENCKTRPNYNLEGQTKAIYCYSHKLENMIDIVHKRCLFDNCKTRPSFNLEGKTKPIYCSSHKLENMIDIVHKRCLFENCKIKPIFNLEGETKPIYCSSHKLENMIDIKNKRCLFENCQKQPSCNLEGETKAIYCSSHKLEGMINIVNKRCLFENCQKQPVFNLEHKSKAIYCYCHKLEAMINVKDKRCKTHLCYTLVSEKYDGYCLFCYMNLFPDKPTVRNYKTKEFSVVEYVKSKYPDFTWISDKTVIDGCSKKRPDLLLDLGYQIIIIEVDENQHIDYDCSCENKRIMELSQDVNHRNIVFIRFNPDEYKSECVVVTSCWGINKNGICVVKKTKQNEWEKRLESLSEQIDYWLENKTDKMVEIIQLFYDI
jgi:hypothetical protein